MVEQLATYLLEVYGPEEALEFSVRAAADSRAQGKLARAAEWELVVDELRDPKRIAKLLRDVERVVELPEHAAWCIAAGYHAYRQAEKPRAGSEVGASRRNARAVMPARYAMPPTTRQTRCQVPARAHAG